MTRRGTRTEPRAEHFPHDADLGVRGTGPTREAAFEQAARALFGAVADLATIRGDVHVRIDCAAPNDVLLLADWLNALIYHMAVDHLVFGRFTVALDDHRLRADAWGERIDPGRHDLGVEPKGATYTALKVAQGADGAWTAECVIDV